MGNSLLLLLLTFVLLGGVVTLGILFFKKSQDCKNLAARLKGIVDIEAERRRVQEEYTRFLSEINRNTQTLREDYQRKRVIYETLVREVNLLEEELEDISFGLYKPHFDFDTPEEYKAKLTEIREKQKQMLKAKQAATCPREWTVQGSKAEGKKMVERTSKLMLRAFNGECDSALAVVRWNNTEKMLERVEKAFDAINKLGEPVEICLSIDYLKLKRKEIRLAHEHQEKLNKEKEEQRRIRDEMREEEKVRREVEKAREEAEKEAMYYEQALEKARKDLEGAASKDMDRMNMKVMELERRLAEAQEMKQRAISRAQLTRSGHVYVISNIGSFGEKVFKIGLTRRLEPLDRVKELGDASVPFAFDVHAMIYSEDAPSLETKLHRYFESRRLNLVNERKEFFRAKLDEIERVVKALDGKIEFTRLAEAREYRETLALRKTSKETADQDTENDREEQPKAPEFPASL